PACRNGDLEMPHEPEVEQRAAQPYVGIRMPVTMEGFGAVIDAGFPEIFGWLEEHGIARAGPPFIRYLVIDMEAQLEVELAVPVRGEVEGDGRVRVDVLPAGRYVTFRHVGSYDGLIASNAALQQWAQEQGIALDSWATERGSAWRGRVEHYVTDPSTEPDPAKWEVDVAYLATGS
ncbi:MAG TPA: GyrI-like domain-containing protein, partial [Acidimicrobiia bacterium]